MNDLELASALSSIISAHIFTKICTRVASRSWGTVVSSGLRLRLTDRRNGDEDVVSWHRVVVRMPVGKELLPIIVEIRCGFERATRIAVKQTTEVVPGRLVGRLR